MRGRTRNKMRSRARSRKIREKGGEEEAIRKRHRTRKTTVKRRRRNMKRKTTTSMRSMVTRRKRKTRARGKWRGRQGDRKCGWEGNASQPYAVSRTGRCCTPKKQWSRLG